MGWLTETARVVAVEHDAVWVEADRSAACGKCAARVGCGQGALSALLQSGKGRVKYLGVAGGGIRRSGNATQIGRGLRLASGSGMSADGLRVAGHGLRTAGSGAQ